MDVGGRPHSGATYLAEEHRFPGHGFIANRLSIQALCSLFLVAAMETEVR
ncbi:MAG: hypothetical protein KatS3mg111_4214 [Pirellulaceae bacterium]|nr:MAG: hypothetical protein KatS3mg111_4214 [Pirellulaceae bacterium]